jgi:hypothetical protein
LQKAEVCNSVQNFLFAAIKMFDNKQETMGMDQ